MKHFNVALLGFGTVGSGVYRIVSEHGGRIWAQSDGVKVNTFSVKLPCAETPPTA